jgi:pSer/pThr/pTyr-binding forkhead associated (FHA) protein
VSDALPWVLLALRVVMAAALIAIVAISACYAWREYREQPRSHAAAALTLDLALDHGARAYRIDGEAWIGRDPNCLVCLTDSVVSARHARLFWFDGAWCIEDVGSRNGTRVNGQVLAKPTALAAGDLIEIGAAQLTVSASA